MLSAGILSWKAHGTLRATLATCAPLREAAGDCVVFFNEITDADRELAAQFGFRAEGSTENLGILGGTRGLVSCMRGDEIILLQNDNPVNVPPDVFAARIAEARALLASGGADMIRLRDRFDKSFADAPKYLRYWPGEGERDTLALKLRRLMRPFKARRMAGRAHAALRNPETAHPDIFERSGGIVVADSRFIDYSDQPFLARRSLAAELLDWAEAHKEGNRTLNGLPVPEIIINGTGWRGRGLKIGVSDGVFAHRRLDDSFRPDNAAYNASIAAGA